MAKVIVKIDKETGEKESLESMIKRFKKQVMNDNLLEDIRKKDYYVPKSLHRKLKADAALKRLKHKMNKNKNKNRKTK